MGVWGGSRSQCNFKDCKQPSQHKARPRPETDRDVRQTERMAIPVSGALFPRLRDKTHPPRIDRPLDQTANDPVHQDLMYR